MTKDNGEQIHHLAPELIYYRVPDYHGDDWIELQGVTNYFLPQHTDEAIHGVLDLYAESCAENSDFESGGELVVSDKGEFIEFEIELTLYGRVRRYTICPEPEIRYNASAQEVVDA